MGVVPHPSDIHELALYTADVCAQLGEPTLEALYAEGNAMTLQQAIDYALKFGRGLKKDLTDQFVGMYVNEDTLDMGEEGERALNLLFDKGYRAGIFPSPTIVDILRR